MIPAAPESFLLVDELKQNAFVGIVALQHPQSCGSPNRYPAMIPGNRISTQLPKAI